MRKILSMLLVLAMALCLLPVTAGAAAATSVEVGGVTLSASKPYYVNGVASAEADGYTAYFDAASGKLTLKDAAIEGSIETWGDLEIVLEGANTITASGFSYAVDCGGNLVISGSGSLEATATTRVLHADQYPNCTITFNGGTVTATTDSAQPAIVGPGGIIINGGTVKGVSAGSFGLDTYADGKIVINGGTMIAQGAPALDKPLLVTGGYGYRDAADGAYTYSDADIFATDRGEGGYYEVVYKGARQEVTLNVGDGRINVFTDGYQLGDTFTPVAYASYVFTGSGSKELNFFDRNYANTETVNGFVHSVTFRDLRILADSWCSAVSLWDSTALELRLEGTNYIRGYNHPALQHQGSSQGVVDILSITGSTTLTHYYNQGLAAVSDQITISVPQGISKKMLDGSAFNWYTKVGVVLAPMPDPQITRQPENVTVVYGEEATVSLETEALSGYGYTYQWYAGDAAIEGAVEQTLTIPAGQAAGSYDYHCVVTIADGENTKSVQSETATVTVEPKEVALEWSELTEEELKNNGEPKVLTATVTNALEGDEVTVTVALTGDNVNHTEEGFYYTATGLEGANAANYQLGTDVVSPTYVIANNDPSNPATGDAFQPVLWIGLMVLCLMAMAVPAKVRK